MPRKPDPTRKPELLGQILDHLTGRTLATVSFRTLADALGVSTYVFVYHFGNRAQLIEEIVRAVVGRLDHLLRVDPSSLDDAGWRRFMAEAWAEVSTPRNLQLQRLEFEAAMLEMVDGDRKGIARSNVAAWQAFAASWAEARGVDPDRSEVEARLFTDGVYGLQYDAMATGEIERVGAAFAAHADAFARRVESLSAASV
jgi:AcrR family transcriptional regulator